MSRADKSRHGEVLRGEAVPRNGPEQQSQAAKCYGKAMIRTRKGKAAMRPAPDMNRDDLQWKSQASKRNGMAKNCAERRRHCPDRSRYEPKRSGYELRHKQPQRHRSELQSSAEAMLRMEK